MAKNLLADRLRALSAQLGRALDTTGTPAELESRIKEAEEELAQLNMPDGSQRHEDITDPDTGNGNNGPNLSEESDPDAGEVKDTDISKTQRRSVRLRHTLHVRYYKKGADPRHPGLEKQVDEVVIGGKVIRVDAAEAALLIADGDADAE